jgi:hypothetical protein
MANLIETTNINPQRFVPVSSRYVDSTVLYYGENKLLTFNLYRKQTITFSENDSYFAITAGTQYRPDLVSMAAYGTVDFWWKIMEANNMKDIMEFKIGKNIVIPKKLLG